MSRQLKRTETPGHALRRVCLRHVAKALDNLKESSLPETVHAVRREIKKLRALLRLTKGDLPHREYRRTAKLMRLSTKPLAATRDARVIQKAFETLTGRKARRFSAIASDLATYLRHSEHSFQEQDFAAVTKRLLKDTRDRLAQLELTRAGWADIRPCLEQTYARGRAACQLALRHPTPEHFHQWRKRVKDLGYQLNFLCPNWPLPTKRLLADLDQLGEQLGNEHDLVLLGDFVKRQCEPGRETVALQAMIASGRQRHRLAIRPLGARLYAPLPGVFCHQLEGNWKAWHRG